MQNTTKYRDYGELSILIKRSEIKMYDLATKARYAEALEQAQIIKSASAELVASLEGMMAAAPAQASESSEPVASSVEVAKHQDYTNAYPSKMTHKMILNDQRKQAGMVSLDIHLADDAAGAEISPGVMVEVGDIGLLKDLIALKNEQNTAAPAMHLYFDRDRIAASFYHQATSENDSRYIVRLGWKSRIEKLAMGVYALSLD